MKSSVFLLGMGLVFGAHSIASANLLTNGNLDRTYQQEIVPGFFLPKPESWINDGSRSIAGPYEDEMSSEEWAGPAPTPVTTDGFKEGVLDGKDYAVFYKAFSGSTANGAATGHLYQDVAGSAGTRYTLTGWAGAEPNFLATDAEFAIEFLDANSNILGGTTLSLMPGLFVDNGEAFDYKQYSLSATAVAGTAFVRARASMIGGMGNPAGGGQAFVIDDFELTGVVPEPATMAALGLGVAAMLRRRRK